MNKKHKTGKSLKEEWNERPLRTNNANATGLVGEESKLELQSYRKVQNTDDISKQRTYRFCKIPMTATSFFVCD